MQLSVLFLYCFLWSFLGVIPPGIINVNAAKISVEQGRTRALVFTCGACLIVALQAGIAVLIAEFLNLSADELSVIKKIGIVIFCGLSVYFFISAKIKSKPKEIETHKKSSAFFKGMLFSLLNVFPIPFYSFVCTTLTTSGNFKFSTADVIIFISAIVFGSFAAISTYVLMFKKSKNHTGFSKKANYILSVLTLALAVYAVIKLNIE